ncbi:SIR2 family protein [Methylobacterium sp. Leaf89]|uniref:SIR2 family protein n=1 Tax=Methylobacterium sp. Leaf89 TaxID=1736245 RepID=UPI0009E92340|nr:SIR2 family protein [Methylobacterium sp. Leaf89]
MSEEAAKPSRYDRYVDEISEDIAETVQEFGCQPILFVGSGLSRRYFGAPSWDELLARLAHDCSKITKNVAFYKQSFGQSPVIGEEFAKFFQDWAWEDGKPSFPDDMFEAGIDAQAYIKFWICKVLQEMTPAELEKFYASGHEEEINSLRQIKPHAIITTNYDQMLEVVFPDHQPIIGQQILKGASVTVGEIFKVHGCVSDYNSLVFTQTDYDNFSKKKKFLSAKLLTFFSEHPLIFLGYSASDPNIKAILSDIDEALPEKGGLIPNVYILEWNSAISPDSNPAREKVLPTDEDRTIRVKLIEAQDFKWVFDAFAANPALNHVNPRVLRALVARSYDLVRHDIPKMKVEADFKMLTEAVDSSNSFAKLFGIANISKYTAASATHPFSATQVGVKLGSKTWHITNQMIDRLQWITKKKSIRSYDNRYHICDKLNTSENHRYSQEAVDLLLRVRDGQDFALKED